MFIYVKSKEIENWLKQKKFRDLYTFQFFLLQLKKVQ